MSRNSLSSIAKGLGDRKSSATSDGPAPASSPAPSKISKMENLFGSALKAEPNADDVGTPGMKKKVEFPTRSPMVVPASEPSISSGQGLQAQSVGRRSSFLDSTLPQSQHSQASAQQRSRTELPPRSPLIPGKFPSTSTTGRKPPSYGLDNPASQAGTDTVSINIPGTETVPPPGLERTSSLGSMGGKKLSQGSNVSQPLPQPAGVQRTSSIGSQGQRASRQGSFSSAVGRINVDATSVASHESTPPVDYQKENQTLRAQVESLQRLMHDNTAAHKVKTLEAEIQTKAKKIQQLEKDKKALQEQVAKMKTENRKSIRKSRDSSPLSRTASAMTAGDDFDPATVQKLKQTVMQLEQQLLEKSSVSVIPPEQVSELQENVCHLRQHVAEKDVELRATTDKLSKAQEALLAGISWEKEVKLSETRKALKTLLKRSATPGPAKTALFGSPLPQVSSTPMSPFQARKNQSSGTIYSPKMADVSHRVAGHELFPNLKPHTPVTVTPVAADLLPNPATSAYLRSTTVPVHRHSSVHPVETVSVSSLPGMQSTSVSVVDITGKEVVYALGAGGLTKSIPAIGFVSTTLTHLVFVPTTGELRDASGSIFLGAFSRNEDTLSRLGALAEQAGCRHNIPAPRNPSQSTISLPGCGGFPFTERRTTSPTRNHTPIL